MSDRQLRGSNVDLAGGRAKIGGREQAIRTPAGAKTIVDLAATRIALPNGGEVRLDDIGFLTDTIAEPRTFARFDGTPVVGFSILRSKGASDVVVADAVAAQVAWSFSSDRSGARACCRRDSCRTSAARQRHGVERGIRTGHTDAAARAHHQRGGDR